MRVFILSLLIFVLCSCSIQRRSNIQQRDYIRITGEWHERVVSSEKQMVVYRDSLETVKGLMERSSNIADSASRLETSYARSDATLRNGKLHHSIENKDSIPVHTKYIFIKSLKCDTLEKITTDTLYAEITSNIETVTTHKRFGDTFLYTCGWITWLAIAGIGIRYLYHIKKNRK